MYSQSGANYIEILVPNKEDLSSIDSFMETIADKTALREQLRDELNTVDESIDIQIQSLYREK